MLIAHFLPTPLLYIEYLYLPAVRTAYASEFGHLIRILSIYAKVEFALDEMNGGSLTGGYTALGSSLLDPEMHINPTAALKDAEQLMEVCPLASFLWRRSICLMSCHSPARLSGMAHIAARAPAFLRAEPASPAIHV